MLLVNILSVCESSSMGFKCYFSPLHFDLHKQPLLVFICIFARIITGKCCSISLGAFEKFPSAWATFVDTLPLNLQNPQASLSIFLSGTISHVTLSPSLSALQCCTELTRSTSVKICCLDGKLWSVDLCFSNCVAHACSTHTAQRQLKHKLMWKPEMLITLYFKPQKLCKCKSKIKSLNKCRERFFWVCTSNVQDQVAGITSIKAIPWVAFGINHCCFGSDNIYSFKIYIAPVTFIGNSILD